MGNGTYTTDTYLPSGQVRSLINFAPDGTINSEFTYTYDVLGHVQTMTTLEGTTTYGYDSDGQLISVLLPTGEFIEYTYDPMGNRTSVIDNGVATYYTTKTTKNLNEYTTVGATSYHYDLDGNLTSTTGPQGTTFYTYDTNNRLIGVQTPTDTWTYTYDALGNRIASTYNGQVTQYLINPMGSGDVVAVYDGSGNLIANYTYGLGLTSQVNPSGGAAYYDFDLAGSDCRSERSNRKLP